jgi:AcrR family transcriptional regulator
MAQVADAAGVAVQTVYFAFHTKAALLSRALDFAVLGEEDPRPPESQAWYAAMVAEIEPQAALQHLVAGVGALTRRVMPIALAARAAAEADAEAKRVVDFHERWRADGYRTILDVLRSKGALRQELTPERATDVLLLFLGSDVYIALVGGRGWSHAEWVDWTVAILADQLFGPLEASTSAITLA